MRVGKRGGGFWGPTWTCLLQKLMDMFCRSSSTCLLQNLTDMSFAEAHGHVFCRSSWTCLLHTLTDMSCTELASLLPVLSHAVQQGHASQLRVAQQVYRSQHARGTMGFNAMRYAKAQYRGNETCTDNYRHADNTGWRRGPPWQKRIGSDGKRGAAFLHRDGVCNLDSNYPFQVP
jgi:hypothetical protein